MIWPMNNLYDWSYVGHVGGLLVRIIWPILWPIIWLIDDLYDHWSHIRHVGGLFVHILWPITKQRHITNKYNHMTNMWSSAYHQHMTNKVRTTHTIWPIDSNCKLFYFISEQNIYFSATQLPQSFHLFGLFSLYLSYVGGMLMITCWSYGCIYWLYDVVTNWWPITTWS